MEEWKLLGKESSQLPERFGIELFRVLRGDRGKGQKALESCKLPLARGGGEERFERIRGWGKEKGADQEGSGKKEKEKENAENDEPSHAPSFLKIQ
jgi:hypothetical protein